VKTLNHHIKSLGSQLKANAWIKALLLSVSIVLLASTLDVDAWILTTAGVVFATLAAGYLGAFRAKRTQAVHILHDHVKGLEFSLELLQKRDLSIAEQLQIERISSKVPPKVWVVQEGLLPFFVVLILACGISFLPSLISTSEEERIYRPAISQDPNAVLAANVPVLLSKAQVQIKSPAYTGIPLQTQESLDIKALKTSQIRWNLAFQTSTDLQVFMVNSAGEKLKFKGSGDNYQLQEEIAGSGIYSVQAFRDDKLIYESDYYTLEAVEDQSPQIVPEEKETYKFFFPGNDPKLSLKAQISDDFRVNQVYIVATLVRGKGENVKFRETKFQVEKTPFSSKKSDFDLNVNSLDFQPGDELYYYWAAVDNQTPEGNLTRTDTYFVKYFDDSEESNAVLEGMAIQILPEYFRSQRQIIIDTEKLLAEKSKKSEKQFNSTSNEIGYDQKLLRLRYGQYLGEEFETAAVGVVLDVEEGGDLLRGYMHLHDQEGEHEEGLPVAPSTHADDHGHGHGEENSDANSMENLMKEYIHAHDSEEMNTYFEQSTRSALKSALEQMWQAELHLRLFEPEKSLPYQNKALELLKAVQQKSRVYVKRTSYDPPPIKEEEKRLSGELNDLEKQIQKDQRELDRQIEPLASATLGFLAKTDLSAQDRSVVQELGNLWTQKTQNSKLADWNLLLHLQQLEAGKLDEVGKKQLREKLYPLAKNYKNPGASYLSNETLKSAFRKNLR
jgi:hypothetical protein